MPETLNEKRIEDDFARLNDFLRLAWSRDLTHVEAFIERSRVELIVGRVPAPRKQILRAVIDYFETALDEREKEHGPRKAHPGVLQYVRNLLDRLVD